VALDTHFQAFDEGIVGRQAFAISVWALVLATFMSPLLFRRSLRQRLHKVMSGVALNSGGDGDGGDQFVTVVTEEAKADGTLVKRHETAT